jgi:hypothetical protein
MANKAVFAGLVFDEADQPLATAFVGGDAFYVIDDNGFQRHIDATAIDRPVLTMFIEQLQANRGLAVPEALRMLGQDDIFTKAAVDASIDQLDVEQLTAQGIPSQARDMIGMMGFRIIVNYRGEIVRLDQPALPDDEQ